MIFKGHLHLQLKENGLRMNPIYSSEKKVHDVYPDETEFREKIIWRCIKKLYGIL